MNFNDFLSEEDKHSLHKESVKVGNVLECHLPKIGKEKRFVIVSITTTSIVGFLLINSKVNKYMNFTAELIEQHYPIKSENHDFIRHDSFVDCTEIFEIGFDAILGELVETKASYLGEVDQDTLGRINGMLKESPIIPQNIKSKFGF